MARLVHTVGAEVINENGNVSVRYTADKFVSWKKIDSFLLQTCRNINGKKGETRQIHHEIKGVITQWQSITQREVSEHVMSVDLIPHENLSKLKVASAECL